MPGRARFRPAVGRAGASRHIGTTSVLLSLIGFLRWVFVVPPLARSYDSGDRYRSPTGPPPVGCADHRGHRWPVERTHAWPRAAGHTGLFGPDRTYLTGASTSPASEPRNPSWPCGTGATDATTGRSTTTLNDSKITNREVKITNREHRRLPTHPVNDEG
jgi:hypothetical protein